MRRLIIVYSIKSECYGMCLFLLNLMFQYAREITYYESLCHLSFRPFLLLPWVPKKSMKTIPLADRWVKSCHSCFIIERKKFSVKFGFYKSTK